MHIVTSQEIMRFIRHLGKRQRIVEKMILSMERLQEIELRESSTHRAEPQQAKPTAMATGAFASQGETKQRSQNMFGA
jgi:hypothetical protein